jgi:hypothetical protein
MSYPAATIPEGIEGGNPLCCLHESQTSTAAGLLRSDQKPQKKENEGINLWIICPNLNGSALQTPRKSGHIEVTCTYTSEK